MPSRGEGEYHQCPLDVARECPLEVGRGEGRECPLEGGREGSVV